MVLFTLIILGINILDHHILNKKYSNNNKEIIILGDSHTETGINDSLDVQLNNISQASETYFFTYFKLKNIFSIKKPKKVILGFSPHNLSFFQDEKTYAINGSERYKDLYPKYFFCLNTSGIKDIISNSNGNLLSTFIPTLKINIKSIIGNENAYIGQYLKSEKSILDTNLINEKINIHFYPKGETVYDISQLQIDYIKKINDLCRKNNIEFYLVYMPLHKLYKDKIPSEFNEAYREIVNQLKKEGIVHLDYSLIDLPDKCFLDGDHLNSFGSEIITLQLLNDLDL
ncbi:hypothetical protein [Cyclobacterium sp. SYSU L10401]|uniref:hypothetical protein n=1 Tax=Cyclobacterium sp. SYSU L10401 TaxID=2678657 RepID=UPI0013D4EB41|nr:hypothetical protein [Cyclobacterium sp. SYSU L10401]